MFAQSDAGVAPGVPRETSGIPAPSSVSDGGRPDVAEKLSRALALHQQGQLAAAQTLYGEVLREAPADFDALHYLGVLEGQKGRHAEAIALITRALAINPASAEANSNLGNALLGMRRAGEALACFRQALALQPDNSMTLYNEGNALSDLNRFEEALTSYERALALKPDYANALCNRGNVLRKLGRPRDALASYASALGMDPSHHASWTGFSECLIFRDVLDEKHRPLLIEAFRKDNLYPENALGAALEIICRDPFVQELLGLGIDPPKCARRLEAALGDGTLERFFQTPLLLAVLEETVLGSPQLERVFTVLRRVLLMAVTRSPHTIASRAVERFTCALALQCFANEYIYAESRQERDRVATLIARTSSCIDNREPFPAIWISLVGAYQALYKLGLAEKFEPSLLQSRADIGELIKRQLSEPKREAQISSNIPSLSKIDDEVSNAVRRQYEEHPYPRWRKRSSPSQGHRIDAVMRDMFPEHAIVGTAPESPEILVAGCGTGSQPILTARRFSNARIVAIDLSYSSLAYAQRATDEQGITNIDYLQGDILKLGDLQKQFDLIECAGVLHHMRDPLQGWRVLAGTLRPGGYMKIGLYSRRARRNITATQEFIRQRGYASTTEGIRQCRQAIMSGDCSPLVEGVSGYYDFYSMSCCRDLLFHVQEHLFSPLEIQACLDELGLQFLGFEPGDSEVKSLYQARFPEDAACNSLANWECFEEEHPDTFRKMYQFWVRKN